MANSADNMILPQWLLLLSTPIKAHTRPSPDNDPSTPMLEKGLFFSPLASYDDEMGFAAHFTRKTLPMALALPWVASMLMSWIPFTKIGLSEAPTFLTLAAVVSTLEVLSIVAVFIYTSICAPNTEPVENGRLSTLQEKFLRAWFWFLFISPFVSSILVVLLASDRSCDEDEDLDLHQPICKVGVRLVKATALCRAAIISAIFLFAMSSWLDSRSPKPVEVQSPRKSSKDTPQES
ncbi:hypothetical protein N0V84_007994 [Fusarium piperis]|uniref:Uncharacterized protein n=1 Tax=Fusarium piperis TaxID=1435070 RepID=A0A9W9BMY7_9HYPO|nr:hypothetical protein N0V84_007994 [Fusarium piperis]